MSSYSERTVSAEISSFLLLDRDDANSLPKYLRTHPRPIKIHDRTSSPRRELTCSNIVYRRLATWQSIVHDGNPKTRKDKIRRCGGGKNLFLEQQAATKGIQGTVLSIQKLQK